MAGLDLAADEAASGRLRLGLADRIHEFGLAVTPTGLGPQMVLTFGRGTQP
jgi:hypothetical protein